MAVSWIDLFNLEDDSQLRDAITLLNNFSQAYSQFIDESKKKRGEYIKTTEAIIKQNEDLAKSLEKINPALEKNKESLSKLINEVDKNAKAIEKNNKAVKGLDDSIDKLTADQKKYNETLKQTNKQEDELIKLQAKLNSLDSSQAEAITRTRIQIQERNKQLREQAKEQLGLVSAYQKESKRLTELRKNYKDLAVQGKANTKESKALLAQITALDSELKSIDETVGQGQRSVGLYGEAIEKAGLNSNRFVAQIKSVGDALKLLAANPIFLAITVLVGLLGTVQQYFKRTERGTQQLRVGLAFLDAAFSKIIDVVIAVGESIVNFVTYLATEPKKAFKNFSDFAIDSLLGLLDFLQGQFTNRITASFNIVSSGFSLIKKAIKGEDVGGEFDKLKESAIQLATGIKDFEEKATQGIENVANSFENATKSVDDFTKSIFEAGKAGAELQRRENNLIVARREFLVQSAKLAVAQAESVRLSKDENASDEARRKALQETLRLEDELFSTKVRLKEEELEIQKLRNAIAESGEEDLQREAELEAELILLRKETADRSREFENRQRELENKLRSERFNELKKEQNELSSLYEKRNDLIKKSAIEQEKTEEELNKELENSKVDFLIAQIELLKKYGEDYAKIQGQITDIELQEYLKRNKGQEDSLNKKLDKATKIASEISSKTIQGLNSVADIGSAINAKEEERDNLRLENLEEKKTRELEIVGDNADARALIEERYDKQVADIEKEASKRKRELAIFQKAISVSESIINTAVAVTANLGNPILAAAIGVAGALQTAAIVAQPIPQFFKGTDNAPKGWADVGERGRELKITPSGEVSVTPSTRTRTYLEEGTRIIPNSKTVDILKKDPTLSNTYIDSNGQLVTKSAIEQSPRKSEIKQAQNGVINYERQKQPIVNITTDNKEVVRAVKNIPVHQTYFDDQGVSNYVQTQAARVKRLNKYKA